MSLLCGLAGRRERITTALALFALGVDQWMTGATVTPDATRFARSDRAVRTTTPAESGRRLLPVAPGHFDPSEAAVAVVNWRAVAAFAGGASGSMCCSGSVSATACGTSCR
ncbi:hypothetical protein ACFC08_31630 [Streptomyces sp. NPDC056112]|uniref:hypothetical protein n=1 Tax=unclassified Streptomyces TaxID=2593676 RepID=UPI001CD6B02F|nr:hypothetical protein [Streptomyces sp. CoT10]